MGRNKKIHDLYETFVQFRLSRSQYDFLCSYCNNLNMSISSYLRKHIDSLMVGSSFDYLINYLTDLSVSPDYDQKERFYFRMCLEVLNKHRKVG